MLAAAQQMFSLSWQDREQELEQLTKELRQVNLQQFIQQTGTKVTVLPADPVEMEAPHAELERGEALRLLWWAEEGAGRAFTHSPNARTHNEVNALLAQKLACWPTFLFIPRV